jgi:hypothetical protein
MLSNQYHDGAPPAGWRRRVTPHGAVMCHPAKEPGPMIVTCHACQIKFSLSTANRLEGVAECVRCGAKQAVVVGRDAPSAMASEAAAPRSRVDVPDEITIEEEAGGTGYRERQQGSLLTLARRRRRRSLPPLALRLAVLLALVAIWIYDAVALGSVSVAMVLFPVTAFALVSAWDRLVRFVNRTVIRVDTERVTVNHGPLPSPHFWWNLERDEVRQLFSAKVDARVPAYQVRALLGGDVWVGLVDGLDTPEEAVFIEQRLEDALVLVDREVDTELPRESTK